MRRKENKELLNILVNEISYERRYKLIDAAYGKLLKVRHTKNENGMKQFDPILSHFRFYKRPEIS